MGPNFGGKRSGEDYPPEGLGKRLGISWHDTSCRFWLCNSFLRRGRSGFRHMGHVEHYETGLDWQSSCQAPNLFDPECLYSRNIQGGYDRRCSSIFEGKEGGRERILTMREDLSCHVKWQQLD